MIKWIFRILLFLLFISLTLFVWHFYFPGNHQANFPKYENWDNGKVRHILPAANHEQFLIKLSLDAPLDGAPTLTISDSIQVQGKSVNSKSKFWEFYADNLIPNRNYALQLQAPDQSKLCDDWYLKTYPHPDSIVEELTILAFTCAGGAEDRVLNQEIFLKTEFRHRLLQKGLSFSPNVVIANGDHIYWDRQTMNGSISKKLVRLRLDNIYGHLDLNELMTSEKNYKVITQIADAQIAELYGCLLRSTPVYFLPDDHDLFENDEATQDWITLPPEDYGVEGQHTIQNLYYPEFLADRNRPHNLSGNVGMRNRNYGTLRYGKLLEAVLYDCKRHTKLEGENAVLVANDAERWIIDRTINSNTDYLIHIPSTPIAWTAGKWSEWYPDVFQENGKIGVGETKKYEWQLGWWLQHQRLLGSWKNSIHLPVVLQGDLHNSSYALINRSGNLDFRDNPIHAIGTGTLGSGKLGFPSSFRGTGALVPNDLEIEKLLEPIEKNGFSLIHITREKITISMFAWRPEDGVDVVENLSPIMVKEITRHIDIGD